MRVLLIEDDAIVAEAVRLAVADHGAIADKASLGEEGVNLARIYDYDVILLDMTLPDMSGLEVLRQLRSSKIETPVLVLSGLAETDVKVRALDCGADDYVTKPLHNRELVARLRALVRRSKGLTQSRVQFGDLTLDLGSKTAEVAGQPVSLSGKEYQILELLCLRRGATLTKEVFMNHLYGEDEPDSKVIDVFICKLRKKLSGANNGSRIIETVRGQGYLVRRCPSATAA